MTSLLHLRLGRDADAACLFSCTRSLPPFFERALRGVALALRWRCRWWAWRVCALQGLLCVDAENFCVSNAEYTWKSLNELCER